MGMQTLINVISNITPIFLAGIIFISLFYGIAMSKIKYIS